MKKVDENLKKFLQPDEFDELNATITNDVIKQYNARMKGVNSFMMENAGEIDNYHSQFDVMSLLSAPEDSDIYQWRLDPATLTDEELFEETMKLQKYISSQLKRNEEIRSEIQILTLAVKRIEQEKQGMFQLLYKKESTALTKKKTK